MDRKVILVGGFHEIIELCEDNDVEIVGIIDNNIVEDTYWGYPVIGTDGNANILFEKYKDVPVLITPDIPYIRNKLYNYYTRKVGFKVASLISKDAYISRSAEIGEGTIIQRGVNVSSNIIIGKMVKINANVNIMHDCILDNYVTVAPNSVLLGKVTIGTSTYIGANSTLLPMVTIGENVIVGAGAVVTKPVCSNITVKGNPAK